MRKQMLFGLISTRHGLFAIGGGIVGLLVVSELLRLAPGFLGLLIIMAFVSGGIWLGFHLRAKAVAAKALTATAAPTITVFGASIPRPAFLSATTGLFDRREPAVVWWHNGKGELMRGAVPPLPRSRLNEARMFESLVESVRLERVRRGYPAEDRLGNPIWPSIDHRGVLLESVDLDDGSIAHVIAVGLREALDRDTYLSAKPHGISYFQGAWDVKPYALLKKHRGVEYDNPGAGKMPLFRLALIEAIDTTPAGGGASAPGVGIDIPADLPRG